MSLAPVKIDDLNSYEVNRLLSDAWLNINVKDSEIWNPLTVFPKGFEDNPHLWISWLMMQPEYLSFVCKEILNLEIWPMQGMILRDLWNHRFPMLIGSRGMSKSFTLAIYALLRMLLLPSRQIIITGAAFRQSKIIFDYMETIWDNAPILRSCCSGQNQGPTHGTDVWTFKIGNSIAKAIPLGQGDKIRGQRANDIIADEFSSIVREIFETVIIGFGAVSSSPVSALKTAATERLAKYLNIRLPNQKKDELVKDNQIIISGTAFYDFNHFAEYHRKWHSFITSEGRREKLEQIFGSDKVPSKFNYRDYCILRIPCELVPEGFLDEAQLARAKASVHSGIFDMEYRAVFSKDSTGFFKRSVIEKCVANPTNNIKISDKENVVFGPRVTGDPKKKYVFAIDPASEVDNFAITILEVYDNHRRIVYCWTTDKQDYKERVEMQLVKEGDFYGFCARKIRNLMKYFNCMAIAIDSQGGGHQIIDRLSDESLLDKGELRLWPVIDYENPSDTDGNAGLHIIHVINFADNEWTSAANHNLRFDFENKLCLFPYNDAVEIAIAMTDKEISGQLYDTLDDCIFEIEELKNELSTIIVTKTPTGRDKWDTPEIKLAGSKKGRMRKDRYSALLMANAVARSLNVPEKPAYEFNLGWAIDKVDKISGPLYTGPANVVEVLNNLY